MKSIFTLLLLVVLFACGEDSTQEAAATQEATPATPVQPTALATDPDMTPFSILGKWTFFEEGNENMPKPIIQFKEGGALRIDQPNGKGDDGSYSYDYENNILSMTDPRGRSEVMHIRPEGDSIMLFLDGDKLIGGKRIGFVRLK